MIFKNYKKMLEELKTDYDKKVIENISLNRRIGDLIKESTKIHNENKSLVVENRKLRLRPTDKEIELENLVDEQLHTIDGYLKDIANYKKDVANLKRENTRLKNKYEKKENVLTKNQQEKLQKIEKNFKKGDK